MINLRPNRDLTQSSRRGSADTSASRTPQAKGRCTKAFAKVFRKARPRTSRQAKIEIVDVSSDRIFEAPHSTRHGEAEFEPARATARSKGMNTNTAF
jgi:hypothetical protein